MKKDVDGTQQREKLFRQMRWIYLYAPPVLAIAIGIFGAMLLALIPIEGWSYFQKWLAGIFLILGLPALVYWFKTSVLKR